MGQKDDVKSVVLSSDGQLAVSASWDKTLKVWEVPTGLISGTLTGYSDRIGGFAMRFDGRMVLSASSDGTLNVWYLLPIF